MWEKKNLPYKVPADLTTFLSTLNGVHVSWKAQVGQNQVLIGEINVNRLDAIQRCVMEGNYFQSLGHQVETPDARAAVFTLETLGDELGQVVLLYRQPTDNSNDYRPLSPRATAIANDVDGNVRENQSYLEPEARVT